MPIVVMADPDEVYYGSPFFRFVTSTTAHPK